MATSKSGCLVLTVSNRNYLLRLTDDITMRVELYRNVDSYIKDKYLSLHIVLFPLRFQIVLRYVYDIIHEL